MSSQLLQRKMKQPSPAIVALLVLVATMTSEIFGARAHSGQQIENNAATCDPSACGLRAVYPILRGSTKGTPIRAKDGENICIEIRMERNLQPIEIFGYSVSYNAARLTLQSIQRGPLLANFISDCNQSQPGLITCSGFTELPLAPNSSGVLATLCFLVSCPPGVTADSSDIFIRDLRDDMSALAACCNLLICSSPPVGPCPGASLYLNTPGSAIGAPISARQGEQFIVATSIKEISQPIDALSFTLNFDAQAMKFTGAQAGNLLASFLVKECREIAPGRLLCTASGNTPIPANSQGALFNLSFASQCAIGDTSNFTLGNLGDDLRAASACNNVFVCMACTPEECDGPALYIAQTGRNAGEILREQNGDSLRMEIRVKASPGDIAAFGFRVQYDPAKLSFGSAVRATLTRNFAAATAKVLQPGTLICAGFGPVPIARNSEGPLLELRFGVRCEVGDSSEIRITDLSDDVVGLNTCCNYFSCLPCEHDGDVNSDKLLTSGDALCAFEIFLNGGALPASCNRPLFDCELVAADVNCDNTVTSRDALGIFNRALQNLSPSNCFARTGGAGEKLAHHITQLQLLRSGPIRPGSDTLRLQLRAVQPNGIEAFGMLLQYPADALQFLGVQRAAATQHWRALEGRQYLPGFIIVGGFHHEPLLAENATALLELYFHNKNAALDPSSFAASNLTDDFAGASFESALEAPAASSTPQQFKLYQNYPNPLRLHTESEGTIIRYDLPKALEHSRQVEVVIYNIQGQEVRHLFSGRQIAGGHTLRWDGRDEAGVSAPSGVYFYRVRAGDFTASRKLLLVNTRL